MEFRLIYKGPLHAQGSGGGSSRTKDKHLIRKQFHKQLRELWRQQPDLRFQSKQKFVVRNTSDDTGIILAEHDEAGAKTWAEYLADNHQRCGGRFVPLVRKEGGFTCSLDILFLRRDNPGNLIASGGDIDNRIKVLFDGLTMPSITADLGGITLDSDENPFFCLLEDDSLVTSVIITTDRLLIPQDSSEKIHDVELVIHVTVLNPSALFAGNRLV